MKKIETQTSEKAYERSEELAKILRLLSNPDAIKIFYRTGIGIENSTYAMKELGLTTKKYYNRRRELVNAGLVKKMDGVYVQTGLGRIICERHLPSMGKAVDAKDELEFLVGLEGIENGTRRRILEELKIPFFDDSTKVKLLRDYEALAISAIDLYDSAEESVILATNYFDVRVIEATLRAVDRGVTNKAIMGKSKQSPNIQNLRNILSVTFAKALINFASNTVDLKDAVRFADIPYTFCVVDGHLNLIDISYTLNESFIVALLIDDRGVGEKLTKFYETLWKKGEVHSTFKALNSLKSS